MPLRLTGLAPVSLPLGSSSAPTPLREAVADDEESDEDGPTKYVPLAVTLEVGSSSPHQRGRHTPETRSDLMHHRTLSLFGFTVGAALALSACSTDTTPASPFTLTAQIQGWPGGEADVQAYTDALHQSPTLLAQGTVAPDGTFTVDLPAAPPSSADLRLLDLCPDLSRSDPAANIVETGTLRISRAGVPLGATFSASSVGAATFTHLSAGDVRAGYVWADRDLTVRGPCVFEYAGQGYTIMLHQTFDLDLVQGYNHVYATFGLDAGNLTSLLQVGSPPAEVPWLFIPATGAGNGVGGSP
jgi:hypothetical protein